MTSILYLNGKRTTHRAAAEQISADYLNRLIKAAEAQYWEDPLIENNFVVPGGMLTIRFN